MMWQDFVRHVRPKQVVETALPTCGHEETYRVLTVEIRQLLEPLGLSGFSDYGTEYEGSAYGKTSWFSSTDQRPESIIERWAVFLQSIPGRFPMASTRTILHCIEAVGNAALRDITVNQASSFGAWWIAKVWVDEMMLWTAEMGGFLDFSGFSPLSPSETTEGFESILDRSRRDGHASPERPSSTGMGIDFNSLPIFTPLPEGRRPSSGPPTATCK